MQCPYRNSAKDSGCDLVEDPHGIAGVMAREFCDFRDCQECPLFQEALQENLREWTKLPDVDKTTSVSKSDLFSSPVAGFWRLALERSHHARI